jgi:hypothetical protein
MRNFLINLTLIVVSIFFGLGTIVLLKNFSPPKTSPQIHARQLEAIRAKVHLDKVSSILPLPNKTNIILFLRVGCHWCEESMPLYRELSRTGALTIGVLPSDIDTSVKYLKGNDVKLSSMVQANLEDFGISGTPTMLVVRDNKLVEGWDGYQQDSKEVMQAVSKIVKENK